MIRFWYKIPSYIYMLYCPETQLVKIGISDDPRRRLSQIAADCAFDVELLAVWWVNKNLAKGFEAAIHEAFSYCRHHGEWFKMERDEREELASMQRLTFVAIQRSKDMHQFPRTMPSNAFHTDLLIA